MPFTTAHPGIILPLKQWFPRWFSLTGLMSGAMAPDLLYFLQLSTENRGFSHSWSGLFIFCLPAGVVFAFVFHRFFKQEFVRHLPHPLDRRLAGLAESSFDPKGARAWSTLILSVLVGALSHFFWDSWTHGAGELTRHFPVLLRDFTVYGITMPLSRWGQHLSTIAGTVTIVAYAIWGNLLPETKAPAATCSTSEKRRVWFLAAVASMTVAVAGVWVHAGRMVFDPDSLPWSFYLYQRLGLGSWAGVFWLACGWSVVRRINSISDEQSA